MIFKHSGLYIDKSPVHGWGVFIDADVKEGDLIEEAPCAGHKDIGSHINIYFPYLMPMRLVENGHGWFIPSGFSIHLNHSDDPNIRWEVDYERYVALFYATRDINSKEELFINYNSWKIQ